MGVQTSLFYLGKSFLFYYLRVLSYFICVVALCNYFPLKFAITLENNCTRKLQSSRGGCSQRVQTLDIFLLTGAFKTGIFI